MSSPLLSFYDALVLRRPWLSLLLMALLTAAMATQLDKIKIDASADSLMLQGDPSLDFYREVTKEYATEDFLLITWQPNAPLVSPQSLQPLKEMAEALRRLDGVSSVTTILDVPLLESPPVTLSDMTSSDPLPTLEQAGLDLDLEMVMREFTTSPIYADLLVSRDGLVTAVQINLQRDDDYFNLLQAREALRIKRNTQILSGVEEAELATVEAAFKIRSAIVLERDARLVAHVREIAAQYRDVASLFVGGVPMIAADMVSFVGSDLVVFGSSILGIMAVVLAIVFRRVRWVVIPLATCGITVTLMLGLLGATDWRMTVISSNFVAVLLIITLAIVIHLVVRYREMHALDPDGELHERVLKSMGLMAVPCFYTSITTIVAFMSLVVSGIQPVIDFGWMMTVGVCVGLSTAFIVVPCLMLVWPEGKPHRHTGTEPALTGHFARITDEHGRSIVVVAAVLVLITGWGISRLEVENRFIDYFNKSTEIYQGMELLDIQLGGTIPLDIIITPPDEDAPLPGLENVPTAESLPVGEDDEFADDDWGDEFSDDVGFASAQDSFQPSYWFSLAGMRELDRIHAYVDSRPETGKALSLSTVFAVVKNLMGEDIGGVELAIVQKSFPDDMKKLMVSPYYSENTEQARLTVRVKETSKDLRRDEFLRSVRADLADELGLSPDRVQFTGMLVLYNNVLQSLFRSQILTLGAVFGAILVMFLLLFRSFALAVITLAPNALAAGIVLGVMGLAGIPLDIMTITIAAIVVGIGVDDCIHYVHRFMKEFAVDRNYRDAMYRCHNSIGRAMYYTTLTVVIGFATLTLSNFNPSIYFGLLTVLAMVAAVLGALLLLPRLIIVFKPLGPEGAP